MRPSMDLVEPLSITKDEPDRRHILSTAFRQNHFPDTKDSMWNDWRWQLRNRIRSQEQLDKIFRLSPEEGAVIGLPLSITPYYASLMDPLDQKDPLRRTMVPTKAELIRASCEEDDPLHESDQSPLPSLVHRYPDRVLFLTTNQCSSYCRYCTRSRTVGLQTDADKYSRTAWTANLEYIRNHKAVRDVLLSGGDPLMLNGESLEWLLKELYSIKHVEMVRLGTKIPIVLPQRITTPLIGILKKYRPLYISVHCTHPDELTTEARGALNALADAGLPLGSQTVLLKGVNDDSTTMARLMHGLLECRVRPYYLYSCDRIPGSSHFAVPVRKGIEIIRSLRGHTSGYAVPNFVIDAQGGGGKVPVSPNYVDNIDARGKVTMHNWEGKTYEYTA